VERATSREIANELGFNPPDATVAGAETPTPTGALIESMQAPTVARHGVFGLQPEAAPALTYRRSRS
jgi:hypothetical protein